VISLLCWNVAGRVTRLAEQVKLIVELAADVVCLQEVSRRTAPLWTGLLKEAGWSQVVVAPTDAAIRDGRPRTLSVLTAARGPLAVREIPGLPWPERALAVELDQLGVVNVHSPISPSPRLAKVLTHEAIHAYVSSSSGPIIICGDLNTPRREHPDGRVWTFARTNRGRLRPERGERWDQAELALIRGLEPLDYRDAFRALHGPEKRELSWEWQNSGGGYRLDHLIVSREIEVAEVTYLHAWRKQGLSDHSPLFARAGVH
jgi:exonuclease III